MPKLVPTCGIRVKRDGKVITVPIGKPFDFTAEEVRDIKAVKPDAVTSKVLQELTNDPEGQGKTEAEIDAETKQIVVDLSGNAENLNGEGNLDMKKLNAALGNAGLPTISAAKRDAIAADIKAGAGEL